MSTPLIQRAHKTGATPPLSRYRRVSTLLAFVVGLATALGTAILPANAAPAGIDLRDTQWGLTAIRAEEAWKVTKGAGIVVAVLDTGVDATHPDLENRVVAGWSTLTKEPLEAGTDNDSGEHGTHVASIIAGDADEDGVTGIAPEATILPVQVLGPAGGSDRSVADGIDWAVAKGAHVINLSLGGEKSIFDNGGSISCDAVGRAFDAGVVVIVAAGNSGSTRNPENRPASCRGALSVAALDENLDRTFFSSFDATVGISAPGRRIVAAVPAVNIFPYASWDGTSMAAPFVAGVAALVRAAHPEWTASQVVERLRSSALDVNAKGNDPETGAGAVDAAAALGTPARDLATARAAIRAATVPEITSAVSDGLRTTITWDAPVGGRVDRYILRYLPGAGFEAVDSVVTGTKLIGTVDGDAFTSGLVQVIAITDGIERPSMPSNRVSFAEDTRPAAPQPTVTKLTATWVSAGVSVSITTKGVAGTINVTALDWNYGLLGNLDLDVAKGTKTTKVVLPVANDSESRAHVSIISAGVDGKRKQLELYPQYPLAAQALTAGAAHVVVKGSASFSCLAKNFACQGTVVDVLDAKSRKKIATSRVVESADYAVMVPRSKITSSGVYLAVAGKIVSARITIPVYRAPGSDAPSPSQPAPAEPAPSDPGSPAVGAAASARTPAGYFANKPTFHGLGAR